MQAGLNTFSNDTIGLSAQYLVDLIHAQDHQVSRLFKVSRYDSDVVHFIVVLDGGQFVCDCMMAINLGIPCRHYYAILYMASRISFHIGLLNPRYVGTELDYFYIS